MPGLFDMLQTPVPAQGAYAPPQQPDQMAGLLRLLQSLNFGAQSSPYASYALPNFSGGYSTPAFGGQLSLQGQYQPNSYQPAAPIWSLMGSYRQPF